VFIFAAIIIIPLMATDVLPTPAVDDGVCGVSPATATPAAAATRAGGRTAQGHPGLQSQCGPDRGSAGNQA
jgi:hypothetical protein